MSTTRKKWGRVDYPGCIANVVGGCILGGCMGGRCGHYFLTGEWDGRGKWHHGAVICQGRQEGWQVGPGLPVSTPGLSPPCSLIPPSIDNPFKPMLFCNKVSGSIELGKCLAVELSIRVDNPPYGVNTECWVGLSFGVPKYPSSVLWLDSDRIIAIKYTNFTSDL